MAGIQLIQGSTTYNAAGASHPAPIAIIANVICFLSFVGSPAPVSYTWTLSVPAGDGVSVISSKNSAGPSFTPAIVGGAYSVQLDDGAGNTYVLDIQAATLPVPPAFSVYHGQVANIVDYGASPTATAAVNAAAILAAAVRINAIGGGVVFVPAGIYAVTMPSLRFLNYTGVTFQGEGRYVSMLLDTQAQATSPIPATPFAANAFLTFADCTRCGTRDLGFNGANVWSQSRLNTGLTVEARKGIYFQVVSTGNVDCFVEDCYFTNIEGEAAFTETSSGWRCNRNHFYRCQSNIVNPSGGATNIFNWQANDNLIDSPGQSPLQCGGTNWQFCRNTIVMTGGYTTFGTLVLVENTNGGLLADNIVQGFTIGTTTLDLFSIGGTAVQTIKNVNIRGNMFQGCTVFYNPGNPVGIIRARSALASVLNVNVENNVISECAGYGVGPFVAIQYSGGNALSGRCTGNKVFDNAVSGGLDTGVAIAAGTIGGNGLIIGPNDFDSGVTTPYSFAVAPMSDQTFVSGSKTWDPPNVNSGAETTTTVTVTGAALGDIAAAGFSLNLQGMKLTAYVSSSNTVTVVLRNDTGGALDLGSGTLRARCFKS